MCQDKFVIGHWSVSMHLLLVVRIPFVGFVFVLDKSFVSNSPVLVDICYQLFFFQGDHVV